MYVYKHLVSAVGIPQTVIIMTFWYAFWNGLNFFKLFKLYFHLELIVIPMFSMFI